MALGRLKFVLLIIICVSLCIIQYLVTPTLLVNIWPVKITISPKIGQNVTQHIKSAKGMVSIKEIAANVWEPFGYSLVTSLSQLIPVLKQKNPDTCEKIFDDWQKISDQGLTVIPPIDLEPRDTFTLNGYAGIMPCYMNTVFRNDDSSVKNKSDAYWSKASINEQVAHGRAGKFGFISYPDSMSVYHATKYHNIVGMVGAVIGSLTPWVEVICLVNGAKHLFTVDYQKADIDHPNVSFIHAPDLAKGRTM